MKSILFSILLALSFTAAIAEKNTAEGISDSPVLVSLFKQPESSILANTNAGSGLLCFQKCMSDYRRCLQSGGGMAYNYYVCEMKMENCMTACSGS